MEEKIIQITAGRGPLECQWVVAKVLKTFLQEATQAGISYTILSREEGDTNLTVKSVTLQLKGKEEHFSQIPPAQQLVYRRFSA